MIEPHTRPKWLDAQGSKSTLRWINQKWKFKSSEAPIKKNCPCVLINKENTKLNSLQDVRETFKGFISFSTSKLWEARQKLQKGKFWMEYDNLYKISWTRIRTSILACHTLCWKEFSQGKLPWIYILFHLWEKRDKLKWRPKPQTINSKSTAFEMEYMQQTTKWQVKVPEKTNMLLC